MNTTECCKETVAAGLPTPCINPLIYLLKLIFSKHQADGGTLGEATVAVLNQGINVTGSSFFCCPDCTGEGKFYYLGMPETFFDLADLLGFNSLGPNANTSYKYGCCLNKNVTAAWVTEFNITFDLNKTPSCCANDFGSIIQRLTNETTVSDNTLTQLLEGSSLNGKSGIIAMLDYLNSLTPVLTKGQKGEILTAIIGNGVVIKCNGCSIHLQSAGNFQALPGIIY